MLNDDDGGLFIVDLSVVFVVKFEGSAAAWALAGSFAYRQPCDLRLLARLHLAIFNYYSCIKVLNVIGAGAFPIFFYEALCIYLQLSQQFFKICS